MSPRRLLTRYQIGNPRLLLSLILWPVFWGPVAASPPVTITVFNEVANPIDARLFGQFLERAGKSEPGPEGAVATGRRTLRPDVVRTLAGWKIPVVRFPGGTAVELGGPWTNLIDNAPDRATPARPADCRFGFHEFFRLCKDIQAEPLIVVKLTGGIFPWQANTRGCYEWRWRKSPT